MIDFEKLAEELQEQICKNFAEPCFTIPLLAEFGRECWNAGRDSEKDFVESVRKEYLEWIKMREALRAIETNPRATK